MLAIVSTGRTLLAFGSVPKGSARAPAAWTTTDLGHWSRVRTHPVTGYGGVAQFIMGADAGSRVVAYGQAFGGAHSNPRPTTWAGDVQHLGEYEQPYTLFGGEDAIGVDAMTSHAATVLISGAWDGPEGYGAAVWLTRDGIHWTRIADAPGLASARGEQTFASGATSAPDGFHLVGSTTRTDGRGPATTPLAWHSADGSAWTRTSLSTTTDAAARAAECTGAGCTIVGGTLGASQQLRCWRTDAAGAETAASAGPGHGLLDVQQVVRTGGGELVVGAVDHVAALWTVGPDCTGWAAVPSPASTEDATAGVLGSVILLATTTADASRLWTRPAD